MKPKRARRSYSLQDTRWWALRRTSLRMGYTAVLIMPNLMVKLDHRGSLIFVEYPVGMERRVMDSL